MKKVTRKLKRFQHVIEKETGILTCFTPTKVKYILKSTTRKYERKFSPSAPLCCVVTSTSFAAKVESVICFYRILQYVMQVYRMVLPKKV